MDAEAEAKRIFYEAEELEVAATRLGGEAALEAYREVSAMRAAAEAILTGADRPSASMTPA